MATFRYFADYPDRTEKLLSVQHDGHVSTRAHHFTGIGADGRRIPVSRMVEIKNNPSLHACGPKCLAARGFLCECSCGGKNHGRGDAVAATVAP